jgi:hypothetical protein
MIHAPYRAGAKLLVCNTTNIRSVPTSGAAGSTSVGTIPTTKQNPVFHRDRVIVPAANGTSAPRYILWNGSVYTLSDGPASALTGRYAAVWKDRLVLASSNAFPYRVAYSKPGDPTAAWDAISFADTSYDVTGLASMRTQVLVFHDSSVERLRGTTPPDSTLSEPTGDLILDSLYDDAGCYDARSIDYWRENVIFCSSQGIHLTDGAATKNLTLQGGVMNLWHDQWERPVGTAPLTTAAIVYRDYYIVTLRHTGQTPTTFVVDLPTRRVFMFANCDAGCFATAVGATERLFMSDMVTKKVTDGTPMFDPDPTIVQVDANDTNVLPVIATGWYPLSKDPAFKRIEELHLSYETYPFSTGGTFGKTAIGASWVNVAVNFKQASAYVLPVSGTVTKLSIYMDGNGSGVGDQLLKAVIYSDVAGVPTALLGTSVEVTITDGQAPGWVDFTFSVPIDLLAGTYWLGLIAGDVSVTARYAYDTVTGALRYNGDTYVGGATNPFGATSTDVRQISVYATMLDPDALRLAYINAPNGANQTLGEFKSTRKYSRKKMSVRRRLQGVGFRLEQLVPTKDTRLYDFSLRAYPEEDSRL